MTTFGRPLSKKTHLRTLCIHSVTRESARFVYLLHSVKRRTNRLQVKAGRTEGSIKVVGLHHRPVCVHDGHWNFGWRWREGGEVSRNVCRNVRNVGAACHPESVPK